MGSLVQIPLTEINSTLEILAKAGVTPDDLREIRSKPVFAREIAGLFRERRSLKARALSNDSNVAYQALELISDNETLLEVARNTPLQEVALKIAREATPALAATMAGVLDVAAVVKAALEQVSIESLVTLSAVTQQGWRKELILEEIHTRGQR